MIAIEYIGVYVLNFRGVSNLAEVVRGAGYQTVAAGSAEQAARSQAKTIQPPLVAVVTKNVLQTLREERTVAKEAVSRKGTLYDQSYQVPFCVKVNLA